MRMSIILDVDDVLMKFNETLMSMLQDKLKASPPLNINDISDWNSSSKPELNQRFQFLDKDFFATQEAYPGAQQFVKELTQYCDIFIHTAVYPQYVPERFQRIIELFPEINPDHILFGTRKDLSRATFMLDDNIKNVLSSNAEVPILMRQPWNKGLTGLISANTYDDVLTIIKSYVKSYAPKANIGKKDIIALVGPTGSGKNDLADVVCTNYGYNIPKSYTTRLQPDNNSQKRYETLDIESFLRLKDSGKMLEYSVYGRHYYGLSYEKINEVINLGHVIVPIDITGAFMLKNHYDVSIVYIDCPKKCLIKNILEDTSMGIDEKTNRIMAIDSEIANKKFADFVISSTEDLIHLIKNREI